MSKNKFIFIILIFIMMISLTGCFGGDSLTITMQSYEKKIYVGDRVCLTTNKDHILFDKEVVWESSDENVVIVSSDGIVEAVGEGIATVTATLDEYSNVVIFYVTDLEKLPKIEISGPQQVIVDEEVLLIASSNTNDSKVLWTSSDESIASISKTGVVKGIKPGVVTITATLESDSNIYKEIILVVRTGDGIEDVIQNIINKYTYITEGNFDLTSLNNKVVNTVKKVQKSVIGVTNYIDEAGLTVGSTGTGGIYKKEAVSGGYKYTVFTNQHVISDAVVIKVYLGDIDEYVVADLVKSDEETDMAVLTFVHKNEYEPLELGTFGSLSAGDFVIAIGNPGGYTYYGSVTFGMVADEARKRDNEKAVYVQHDAPINPGNSGGPLFNIDGEVIGINTLKIASTTVEGMGFSIAMETFLEFLQ